MIDTAVVFRYIRHTFLLFFMPSVQIENLPKNVVKLTVTVPAEDVQLAMEEAAIRLSEKSAIPGFRPGKAGYEIVKQRLGEMKIMEEALEPIVRKTYVEALMANKIETVGSPHFDVQKMVPGQDLVYTAEAAKMPSITRLADYKKLTVDAKSINAEDRTVETALEDLRRMQTKEVRAAAGTAASGTDKMVMAMNMKKAGVPIEGGQSPNHAIYLGEESYIPGMKEQVSGMKEGEQKSFTLPFPKDHASPMLAGADVEFDVTTKEIFHLEKPTLDDAFATALGQKDIATLKTVVRANIEKEKKEEEARRQEKELLELLAKESRFDDVPDLLLNEEINKMAQELQRAIEEQGLEFGTYLKNIKKTLPELKMDFTPQALMRIKVALVLRAVGEKEGVKIEEKEIDDEIDTLAERYPDPEAKKQIFSPLYREYVETMLKNRKTIAILKEGMVK